MKTFSPTRIFRKPCFCVLLLPIILGLFQEQVFAHAFAYYASTPVTPPREFLWWWPVSMLLLVLGTWIPMRMSLGWSRLFSLFTALIWVSVFAVVFFWMGRQVSLSSTAPEPGLGFPCATYWGRTFSQVGSIFLFWNVFGLFCLTTVPVVILFEAGKKIKISNRLTYWSWIMAIPVCFALGLVPYIVQGAWVHGWGGGYVTSQCGKQIGMLHHALVMYALDHENRLPTADDFTQLYPQIKPYLPDENNRTGWRGKFDVCVIGKAWDRTPKPFLWNAGLTGKEVFFGSYENMHDPTIIDPVVSVGDGVLLIAGKPWVNCPYIHQDFLLWGAGDIRNIEPEKLDRLRRYERTAGQPTESEP